MYLLSLTTRWYTRLYVIYICTYNISYRICVRCLYILAVPIKLRPICNLQEQSHEIFYRPIFSSIMKLVALWFCAVLLRTEVISKHHSAKVSSKELRNDDSETRRINVESRNRSFSPVA